MHGDVSYGTSVDPACEEFVFMNEAMKEGDDGILDTRVGWRDSTISYQDMKRAAKVAAMIWACLRFTEDEVRAVQYRARPVSRKRFQC